MRKIALVLALTLVVPVGGIAVADSCLTHPPVIAHPRVDTFELDGVPVNVLKPAGYEAGSGRRYPVLYLFHGMLAHAEETWLNDSDIVSFTEHLDPSRSAIVVMPGGDFTGWRIDWRNSRYRPETFLLDRLIPYIDGAYDTVPTRSHRAAAGMSAGGWAALHLAAHRPEVFASVGSFSGSGDVHDLFGPGFMLATDLVLGGYDTACRDHFDVAPICGGEELCWRDQSPGDLAVNLHGVEPVILIGNGIPCDEQDVVDLARADRPYYHIEAPLHAANERLHRRLVAAGVRHTYEVSPCGVHTWRYWSDHLKTFWPHMLAARGSSRPATFDHRRALPSFSVWDWTFTGDAARAPEFLDVADASCRGVGLSGSGLTRVETASCFAPGRVVRLSGAREASAVADAEGRISFTVDLGSPHQHQQYTAAARALEAAGGYWTSQTVTFKPTANPPPQAEAGVVQVPVSFRVTNVNESLTSCPTDGGAYTVRGTMAMPARGPGDAVTLHIHGGGDLNSWNMTAFPQFDYLAAMARRGHTSVFIHTLGYGPSDPVDGNQVCFGSLATTVRDVVDHLRAGTYVADGDGGFAFDHVALAGHSGAGILVELYSVSFDNIDALVVAGWADNVSLARTFYTDLLLPLGIDCAQGGTSKTPGGPGGYSTGPNRAFLEEHSYNVDPAVLDHIVAVYEPEPCGVGADAGAALAASMALAPTVDVPVLLMYGDHDPFLGAQLDVQRRRYIGSDDVSLSVLPNTGHMMMFGNTMEMVAATMSSWLGDRGF